MANDLTVPARQTFIFGDGLDRSLQDYVDVLTIDSLDDLVSHGVVGSNAGLDRLLSSAKDVTADSLSSIQHTRDVDFVRGTRRLNLGRFRPLTIKTTDVDDSERQAFWRIFRAVPPSVVQNLTASKSLSKVINKDLLTLGVARAQDIVIEAGATLAFTGNVQTLECRDLLIRRSGQIVVNSSGLVIKASSIEGEQ